MKKTKEMTIPSSLKSLEPIAKKHGRDVFLDNPFVEGFYIEIRQKNVMAAAGINHFTDRDANEINVAFIATKKEVDTEEFLKIYTQNVRYLFELSSTAQKILMPLMLEIQKEAKNVAHVFFSFDMAKENCIQLGLKPISRAVFTRGMSELISKDFLAVNAKGQNWYWINPNILFNGDRIRYIQEYCIKRKDERISGEEQLSLL